MANFQTLTQINDLIQKLEILKAEKENLRKTLKNAKLLAATELWRFEQAIRAASSQKQKSIAHKQGLLLFKESEEDLSAKLKAVYKPQVEAFLPKILDLVIDKIIQKNKLTEIQAQSSHPASALPDQENSSQVLRCQISGSSSLIALLPTNLAKIAQKSKLVNTPDFLQIMLPGRIYLLQREILVDALVDQIIGAKLASIAQINLLQENNSSLPQEPSPSDSAILEEIDVDGSIDKLPGDNQSEPLDSELPPDITDTDASDKLETETENESKEPKTLPE